MVKSFSMGILRFIFLTYVFFLSEHNTKWMNPEYILITCLKKTMNAWSYYHGEKKFMAMIIASCLENLYIA